MRTSLELSFTPTDRAQLAVWIERDDGLFMGTLALTHAVAVAGIGNRPGALQMNSGFRWPYGRREGVLPVWAHRRAEAPDAKRFRRVIFQNRVSEGFASRTIPDQSVDDYYCLSFNKDSTNRDALDAVTCASVFSSDKGRFMNEADVQRAYAEPFQQIDGTGSSHPLSLDSLYPPRRDVMRCTKSGCFDHEDVNAFAQHAVDVMPELDAISRATPEGDRRTTWTFSVPDDWSREHEYVLYIEANVEGDYNATWGPERFPTPREPKASWDTWAHTFGYPYRGQPSVVYALPFSLDSSEVRTVRAPAGYGALHGEDGMVRPLDGTLSDDPVGAPGSGADRLRLIDNARASLAVQSADPCARSSAPEQCGARCTSATDCGPGLLCDLQSGTCRAICSHTQPPAAVEELRVVNHPDRQKAHMWAQLSFRASVSERPVVAYDVKVKPEGGAWQPAFTHDSTQELLPVALDVCSDPSDPTRNRCVSMQPGTLIAVDLAGLKQLTRYSVSVTPRDVHCNEMGPTVTADFSTPERTFTTVSPCFIASATYGSPLASEVGVLRGVRDRYLASHAPGRALVSAYYALGPKLANAVQEYPWLKSLALAILGPIVSFAQWWSV